MSPTFVGRFTLLKLCCSLEQLKLDKDGFRSTVRPPTILPYHRPYPSNRKLRTNKKPSMSRQPTCPSRVYCPMLWLVKQFHNSNKGVPQRRFRGLGEGRPQEAAALVEAGGGAIRKSTVRDGRTRICCSGDFNRCAWLPADEVSKTSLDVVAESRHSE